MAKSFLESIIIDLVQFITDETIKNQYGLVMTHFFWPKKKKWKPMLAEFDDYGDIVTFVAWAGKLLKRKKWIDFANQQFIQWQKLGKNRYGFFNSIKCDKPLEKNRYIQTVSIYDMQDAILGMYEMWFLTKKNIYKQELEQQFQLIEKILKINRGWLPNTIIVPSLLSIPQSSANPAVAGIIAEHAFLYGKQTQNNKYIKLGYSLLKNWLKSNLWLNYNLFHQGYNVYFSKFSIYGDTKFMKENSNMLYAMLEFPQKYRSKISRIIQKLEESKTKMGFYSCWYNADDGSAKLNIDIDKTQNFTVIDAYTYLYRYLKKDIYLDKAKLLAKLWISKINSETGLIPDYLTKTGKIRYHIAKLDQSFDLYSSFLRIYLENKDKNLLDFINQGAVSMAKYFGQTQWWSRIINTQTGKIALDKDTPIKDRPVKRNLTKYVGGALRFYCMLYAVKNNISIKEIHLMSRDR